MPRGNVHTRKPAGCGVCGFVDCVAFVAGEVCTGAPTCERCGYTTCAAARLGLECDTFDDAPPCPSCNDSGATCLGCGNVPDGACVGCGEAREDVSDRGQPADAENGPSPRDLEPGPMLCGSCAEDAGYRS